MIFFKALKYKIMEYCIEVIFEKFHFNFINRFKYGMFQKLPGKGERFAEMYHIDMPNRVYKDCVVTAVFESSEYLELFCNAMAYLYIDGKPFTKYIDETRVSKIDFIIDSEDLHKWRYVR